MLLILIVIQAIAAARILGITGGFAWELRELVALGVLCEVIADIILILQAL